MSRPKVTDEKFVEQAVEATLDSYCEWIGGEKVIDENHRKEIKEDLVQYINYFDDAYDIALELENANWRTNKDILELIAATQHEIYVLHQEEMKKWVSENKFDVQFENGDKVFFQHKTRGTVYGEVIKVDEKLGQCVVFCESLGHVKENGKLGVYKNWEDLSKV